ncbi:MAG: GatB/YqeY domain-containing protein, partial [Thiobacillus sp.]|nr:GatB/YqeY domain-containing protein [Thiobacillus sp.]
MSLKLRVTEDMKTAMRARDTARLGTIRLLLAAIKQREVDERIELDDAAVSSIVEKLIKQRKDSISQFQAAGRDDLVAVEQAELVVLQAYLPEQLSAAEVEAAVVAAIAESGAASAKDMGKVMGLLKPRLAGRA